jgi:hypothetical protein
MSTGFTPQDEQTAQQALQVQELSISGQDEGMYVISAGSLFVLVNEPVLKVYLGRCKVDSTNLWTEFQNANLVICDSALLTPGGDMGAIKFTGLAALATNDMVLVKYEVVPPSGGPSMPFEF